MDLYDGHLHYARRTTDRLKTSYSTKKTVQSLIINVVLRSLQYQRFVAMCLGFGLKVNYKWIKKNCKISFTVGFFS